ncbi:MAG: helix-turn-helix domain-containing protein [Tissierellia bacterium]|nr:helix-turn-helix domain-containing protein [Tissierellia bacterium]
MEIGDKIRNLRHKMGLTQEELAERSDLTKGFISQLENNNTSPSVDTMEALVQALGTNLSDFFKGEAKEQVVYPRQEAFSALYEKLGSQIFWIVSDAQKNLLEPVILELEPSGRSKLYNPFEGEAFGYVLEGQIELNYGDESFLIDQGDSFYFRADRSHFIFNPLNRQSRLLWILTPPNF